MYICSTYYVLSTAICFIFVMGNGAVTFSFLIWNKLSRKQAKMEKTRTDKVMKIAVFTDVHGNLNKLKEVLERLIRFVKVKT